MLSGDKLHYELHYPNFPEFAKFGIQLENVNADLILALQSFRDSCGISMVPSPLQDAWWRKEGKETSRHYAVDRLSDAGDVFPQYDKMLQCWTYAVNFKAWGGVGVYIDTKPSAMLHLDLRSRKNGQSTLWARNAGIYYYPHQKEFWDIIRGL